MGKKPISRRDFLKMSSFAALSLGIGGCTHLVLRRFKCKERINPSPGKVRVMTYNVANARGNNDDFWKTLRRKTVKRNLEKLIEIILYSDADIICLNEVDFDSIRTDNINQAEYIARSLCFNHVVEQKYFHLPSVFSLGNAIISKYPLKVNKEHYFGENLAGRIDHIFKGYVDVKAELPDRNLDFVFLHLDAKKGSNREYEMFHLIKHLKTKDDSYVLLGDFNCEPNDEPIENLKETGLVCFDHIGLKTYPADKPKESIDHIFVSKDLRIKNYRTIPSQASDHLPVYCDIYLP
ncbi:endonuclease/exonuclease/phosphatase family protein [Candidatus Woesearchaeota archaeon]|nr:endonuclease/exonuclease/phosphatase family protein [Candidatus Woesearchaeota archaeon]